MFARYTWCIVWDKFSQNFARTERRIVDETVLEGRRVGDAFARNPVIKKSGEYWRKLGPGLTTGAADDDPSGIGTYSQTGSAYGYQFLWLSVVTFPFMALVQEMCARIGLVTGQGLAANIKQHFSRKVLTVATILLFSANVFNIGADLGAMAKAMQLLAPSIPFALLISLFTVLCVVLQVFVSYARYAHFLKWLTLALLAYVASAFLVDIDWGQVLAHAFIPRVELNKDMLLLVTAVLGTTISPYLFFWQTSQEVEDEISKGRNTREERIGATEEEIHEMHIDVWSGMFFSNLVMFFIIATCAATLHATGITDITSAEQAALALRPIAGEYAYLLFAIGIIATGLLAIPVLAGGASYAISESFGWKEGLYRKPKEAYAFYGVIVLAMLCGFGLNFIGLDPMKALLYSAMANGIVAPLVLFFIVKLSGSVEVMGNRANSSFSTFLGWVVVGAMTATALATLYVLVRA